MGQGRRFSIKHRLQSFKHAFAGVSYVLRSQHNAWIHAVATAMVVFLGLWLELSVGDWALLILAMTVVWVAEFINTAIEATVDLTTEEHHPLAGAAKDVAAGAVLVAAAGAVIIGLLILGPRFLDRLSG
jgi:diacylglycerol kinase